MNNQLLKQILWFFPAVAIQLFSFLAALAYATFHFPFDSWETARELAANPDETE